MSFLQVANRRLLPSLPTWLVLLLLLPFAATTIHAQNHTPTHPNILFIAVDDLNDWVGYLGGYPGTVRTPNLDRLAARGVAFTNAHAQAPLCGPSRTSVMTGLRPSTTGVYGMIEDDSIRGAAPVLDGVIFLPEYFGRHGYHTMGVGKLFHKHAPTGAFADSGGRQGGFGPKPKERFVWEGDPELPGYGRTSTDWGAYPAVDSQMIDHQSADWAIERLGKEYGQPFFLGVGFIRPHVPWYVPPEWLELYAHDSITLPPYRSDDLDDVPTVGHRINDLPMMPSTEWARQTGVWKDIVRAYLASVSFVDHQVGRLLDALEASPHAENTVIVLWSDHGYRLGEKGTFAKHALWEEATRVPLIIVPSRHPRPRPSEVAAPVELLDVYPTLLELAGLPANPATEGRSLVPLMNGDNAPDGYALTTYGRDNHAVRTRHYRYIRYEDGGEELYDHRTDPHEWYNLLAGGGAPVQRIRDSLRQLLPTINVPWVPRSKYDYTPYFTEQRGRDLND